MFSLMCDIFIMCFILSLEIKKVNDKISDRIKHIMEISNTNVNIYDKTPTSQQNSNLDFEEKTFWCFVNNCDDVIRVLNTFFMFFFDLRLLVTPFFKLNIFLRYFCFQHQQKWWPRPALSHLSQFLPTRAQITTQCVLYMFSQRN
jgi:hypothetical protein